jgi:hypothetical protein
MGRLEVSIKPLSMLGLGLSQSRCSNTASDEVIFNGWVHPNHYQLNSCSRPVLLGYRLFFFIDYVLDGM